MKIILVHGDHTERIYRRVNLFRDEAIKRKWKTKSIELGSKKSFIEQVRERSLFSENILYLFESIDKLKNEDIQFLNKNSGDLEGTLIAYKLGNINKGIINKIKVINKVEEYNLPILIWSFLESFYPGNSTNSLKLFKKITENEPPEFIFYLLSKHLRDLYLAKTQLSSDIQPWKLSKLKNQLNKFKGEKLENIIKKMAEIDIKVKTSNTDLSESLDFLIITELE